MSIPTVSLKVQCYDRYRKEVIVMIRIERIYHSTIKEDETRILVDRLWPRGISKEEAQLNYWAKEIAPSTDLRHWFDHDPLKFPEFKRRFMEELKNDPAHSELLKLSQEASHGNIVLLYGAKDEVHNQAVVLLEVLEDMLHD